MEEGQGVVDHHEQMGEDVESHPELWENLEENLEENLPSHLTNNVVENLLITRSPVLGRKEEMKDGQGAKEHHVAMRENVELNPELWKNLPNDLIDIIVDKVLIGLPFSRLLGFCFVCQRWTDLLLSMKYLLYFDNLDEFMIFNPRTGSWESVPVLLSPADALRLQHMELVSCDGGLLYFSTDDKLIVCNPLTSWCSATLTGPNAARLICNAERQTIKSSPSDWRLWWRVSSRDMKDPSQVGTQEIVLNTILASSDTEYCFQLLMGNRYGDGTSSVSVTLHEARVPNDWVTVPDVHRDFRLIVFPTFMWEPSNEKSVMLGFYAYPGRPFNVLLYDIEQRRCHWVWNVHSLCDVGMSRKALFTSVSEGGELEFYAFLDGGLTLAKGVFPPPLQDLRENVCLYNDLPGLTRSPECSAIFNFVHMEQGDIVFDICLFKQSPRVNVSFRTQNVVDGSERISNWMECQPSVCKLRTLPSSRNFHIFTPSLSSVSLMKQLPRPTNSI